MKLFRKKPQSSSNPGENGLQPENFRNGEACDVSLKRQEKQRLFMKQLYHLSFEHGRGYTRSTTTIEKGSIEAGKSNASTPSTPTAMTPTTPGSSTPEQSVEKSRFQQANKTPLHALMSCSPGLESIEAVISQLTACTNDFFGEKIGARDPERTIVEKPRTVAWRHQRPVPTTITFCSSRTSSPCDDSETNQISLSPVRSAPDRPEELEELMERNSLAYKPSQAQGLSIIDNVWVVSQLADNARGAANEEVSLSSSIPTRNSHRL